MLVKAKIETLKANLIHGVTPAMATPLQNDGYQVNTAVIPELAQFLIEAGAKGLFVGGTTGEGILLDPIERQKLHTATITAVKGRVPVILHIGANQTQTAVALAKHAATLEADAIAAVTPFFYGVSDDGLTTYYQAIAQAAPTLPLLLYDIPHLANNGISSALLARLSHHIPSIAGIKTSQLDAQNVRQLIDAAPEHLIVLAGNERLALGLLALGAHGLISGLSTAIPEPFVALTQAFAEGKLATAQQHQKHINKLLDLVPNDTRIGTIKSILNERGIAVDIAVPPRSMPVGPPIWWQMQQIL